MTRPVLHPIAGARDLIDQLEDALTRIKTGELQGVAVIGFGTEGFGWTARVVDGTDYGWARMVAATSDCQREMIALPVEEWP